PLPLQLVLPAEVYGPLAVLVDGGQLLGGVEDAAARGEVRRREVLHERVQPRVRAPDEVDARVDDLAEVVGRDVRRHADGDAGGAVDEEVRERGREDDR